MMNRLSMMNGEMIVNKQNYESDRLKNMKLIKNSIFI